MDAEGVRLMLLATVGAASSEALSSRRLSRLAAGFRCPMLSPLLVFFQLLNNWPSLLLYLWQTTIDIDVPSLKISVEPLQRIQNVDKAYDLKIFLEFSSCHGDFPHSSVFNWEVLSDQDLPLKAETSNCSLVYETKPNVDLQITVAVRSENGTRLANGREKFRLKTPPWVAVIGDSFASGEGSPDKSVSGAPWTDDSCHRSRHSFVHQVVERFSNRHQDSTTLFSFLACSGATANSGLIGNPGTPSQLDTVNSIAKQRGSGPDLVIMTIGANDVGFTDVLQALGNPANDFTAFDIRFFYLAHELDRVAGRLRAMGATRVVLPLYYDITRNENGFVDASCGAFRKVRTRRLVDAERKILRRLNELLRRKGEQHGWIVVDSIPKIFSRSGVCSSSSLVRSPEESFLLQGSFRGAFHPTEKGHKLVADAVVEALERENLL